jgi:hypothetical protein
MSNYKDLVKTFNNIETAREKGIINIIPEDPNRKFPSSYRWEPYQLKRYPTTDEELQKDKAILKEELDNLQKEYGKKDNLTQDEKQEVSKRKKEIRNLKTLKEHNGNFGIVIGFNPYNNPYWLGCLDIDGDKTNDKTEQQTKEDFIKILSKLEGTILIKTQGGGYHLYFLTKTSYDKEYVTNICFPKDYSIQELANKDITTNNKAIELFTNNNRQMAIPPSKIGKNKYERISELKDFNELKVYDDILEDVYKLLKEAGFSYKEIETYAKKDKPYRAEDEKIVDKHQNPDESEIKENNAENTKKLTTDEIETISETLAPYFMEMEGTHSDLYLAWNGYVYNQNIVKKSAITLTKNIMKLSGDKKGDHVREVHSNYKRKNKKKTGLNTFIEILKNSKKFNNIQIDSDIERLREIISIKINYSGLLRRLIHGKSLKIPKNLTLNQIAVILKIKLGLKQELEIKGIHIKDVINDYYIKTSFNTMQKVSFEELYQSTLQLLHGTDYITYDMETNFKRNDLIQILDYTPSSYRKYNILTLNNGLYDFETHEFLEPHKIIERFGEPILTHKTVPFNYNPNAKGKKIKEILRYAFDPYNPTYNPKNKEIKGFYEIGGYSLRSGNSDQKMIFMFGVANSSKSVLNNLINEIHGHRVSSVPLEDFNDRFSTSGLLNMQLNNIRDINNAIIKDNSVIKVSAGNEPLKLEPKGKTRGIIPAIEVPLSISSGNVLPKFENPEAAILRRMLNLEFKNKVPTAMKIDENKDVIEWNKDDIWIVDDLKAKEKELDMKLPIPYVIKDIDKTISQNNDEMEFLLYQFLEHDKTRIYKNNHNFSIEKSHDEILKDLELYSNPVETLLSQIIEYNESIKIEKDNLETIENVGVEAKELFEMLREQARINHVDIPKSNNALGRKVKPAIKYLFDLDKNYNSKSSKWKLNISNEYVSCSTTKIYPKIQYKLLKTNKKHN